MKKVIFVCLLTLSVCLSQPTDVKDPAADAKAGAQANASSVAQPNKTATEIPSGPTVTIPTTTLKPDAVNGTNANNASAPSEKNATSVAPNPDASHNPTPAPIKPESKTEKAAAKNDTTDNKTDKGDNKTDKTDKPTEPPKPAPTTTVKPAAPSATPHTLQARGFDGASFVGGIILTLGLLAIGFMGFKYYKAQTERNYHTL